MTIQGSKKVLVTGIGGHMQGAIVLQLLSEGHTVRVFTDMPDAVKGMKNMEVVQGNIGGREDTLKALDGMDGACPTSRRSTRWRST